MKIKSLFSDSFRIRYCNTLIETWHSDSDDVPLFPCGIDSSIPEVDSHNLAFGGMHWTTLSTEHCLRNRAALSFFTSAGLAYYLPSFLVASLENWDVLVSVLEALSPESTEFGLTSRLYDFSTKQLSLVREYLDYLMQRLHEESDLPQLVLPAVNTIERILNQR